MNSIGVFYYWQPNNKINGSLFYAFEYYSFLKDINSETYFYIVFNKDLTEKDKQLIYTAFNIKYKQSKLKNYDINFLKLVKLPTLIRYEPFLNKALFLDIKSYNFINYLLPTIKKYLYCNNDKDLDSKIKYTENIYYWYDNYQSGNYRTTLKLNFSIFNSIKSGITNDGWFVSSVEKNLNLIEKYLPHQFVIKLHNMMINIYKEFQNILYIHTGNLDTNNRLIPESFFYEKNLQLVFVKEDFKNDSIWLRYNDILENGLKNYTLTRDDIIIKHLLELDVE
jgi:hypothetical protein